MKASFSGNVVVIAVNQEDGFTGQLVSISHTHFFSFYETELFQSTQMVADQLLASLKSNCQFFLT